MWFRWPNFPQTQIQNSCVYIFLRSDAGGEHLMRFRVKPPFSISSGFSWIDDANLNCNVNFNIRRYISICLTILVLLFIFPKDRDRFPIAVEETQAEKMVISWWLIRRVPWSNSRGCEILVQIISLLACDILLVLLYFLIKIDIPLSRDFHMHVNCFAILFKTTLQKSLFSAFSRFLKATKKNLLELTSLPIVRTIVI